MLLTPFGLVKVEKTFPLLIFHILIVLSEEHDKRYDESKEKSQSHTHFLCPINLVFN